MSARSMMAMRVMRYPSAGLRLACARLASARPVREAPAPKLDAPRARCAPLPRARIERSEIRDARNDKPGCRHGASLRAFTPVFDRLWTRVNALMAPSGLHAGN